MKTIFGSLLIILGIFLGFYVGIYLMLVQGIVSLVWCVQHTDIATGIQWAWAIVRIVPLAELLGLLSAFALIIPGLGMIGWGIFSRR